MPNTEWAAWLARPIAKREAIQDKVHATFRVGGVQVACDMMKAMQMPSMLSALVIPAEMLEPRRELEDKADGGETRKPVGRIDH